MLKKSTCLVYLTACLLMLASASIVNAQDTRVVQTLTSAQMKSLLHDQGFPDVEVDSDDDLIVRMQGLTVIVFVRGNNYSNIKYVFSLSGASATMRDLNDWNSTRNFTKTYLNNDGDPALEMDVNLRGGVTIERIKNSIRTYDFSLATFLREVIKVESSAVSAPASEATPSPELAEVTPEPVSCESFSFLKRSAPFTHDAFARIVGGLDTFAAQHNYASPLAPQQQVPAMREAFKMHGWSLPSTLSKLAEGDISPFADGGLRFSMATLLLTPSEDLSPRELSTLYCDRELEDLATLKQKMSRY